MHLPNPSTMYRLSFLILWGTGCLTENDLFCLRTFKKISDVWNCLNLFSWLFVCTEAVALSRKCVDPNECIYPTPPLCTVCHFYFILGTGCLTENDLFCLRTFKKILWCLKLSKFVLLTFCLYWGCCTIKEMRWS